MEPAFVEAEKLEEEVFEFEYHESLDVFLELLEVEGFDDLISTYGVFTLSEMVDIGKFFRDEEFAKDGKVSLIVRLPPADLKKFTFGWHDRFHVRWRAGVVVVGSRHPCPERNHEECGVVVAAARCLRDRSFVPKWTRSPRNRDSGIAKGGGGR